AVSSMDGIRPTLQACRSAATPKELAADEPLLLRTFGGTSLAGPKQLRVNHLAGFFKDENERHWLEGADANDWPRMERASQSGASPSSQLPQDGPPGVEQAPQAPPKSPTEKWSHYFGQHCCTRFAFEVVSRICCQSSLQGAYRKTLC